MRFNCPTFLATRRFLFLSYIIGYCKLSIRTLQGYMDTVQSLVHEVYVPERLGLNRELYYSRYRHFKIMESFSSNQLRALSTASGSGCEAPPAPGSQEEYYASL
jgi:hypothetical protein